uniref:nucleolar complex protein 2 homolog isoform X1 n=1 Tax=Ciona intestinalis TaxID=7719 RepID=UPI000180CC88|nr:nucleolar complex protein 2 homolog isoform X1 [Ciona intestinalis]|eukprot:XP_026692091.1 nucleolar complex protein 2 homolog isoform X1 [Ciona intestinalis]
MGIGDATVEEFMEMDWGDHSTDDDAKVKTSKPERNKKKTKRKKKPAQPQAEQDENIADTTVKVKKQNDETTKKQVIKKQNNKKPTLGKQSGTSHQEQLNALKEKDPEFYKFLQDEESGLLNFEDNLDLDASSSEDEDAVHQLPDHLEEASDSDVDVGMSEDEEEEGDDMDQENRKKKKLITVTEEMVQEWQNHLLTEVPSMSSLRELIKAFHAALVRVDAAEPEEKEKKGKKRKKSATPKLKYKVIGAATFNSVVGLCIRTIVPTLAKLLNYFPKKMKKTKKQKAPLPSTCKKWAIIREDVRIYLADAVTLARTLLEPSVTRVFLRHLLLLLPYFISFPKISKTLLKLLIRQWSSAENESVRVLAFLCITRLITMEKERFLENTMKQTYVSYVANSKFTSPSTLPMINFMQRTFAEICSVDANVTYQFAFLYIRQLAVHLRKAITTQSKETRQTIYNWQFVHSIGIWCRVLSVNHPNETLQALIYPLVQVAIGTIELVPTARFFPLRFHITRSLISLGDCTNTFIPLLNFIMAPLHLNEFAKKQSGVSIRPLAFETILKLSNSQLKEKSYRDGAMDQVYDLFMAYFNTQAHTIAFPELAVPSVVMLKKFIKKCKNTNYLKMMKQIVDRVLEQGEFITKKRSDVTFAVTDVAAVVAWENELKGTEMPFTKHYATYRKNRERELSQQIADKDRNVEENLPAIERTKLMEQSKPADREEFGELFVGSSDEEDAKADFERAIQEGRPKKRKLDEIIADKPPSEDSPSDAELDDEEYDESEEEEEIEEKEIKKVDMSMEADEADIVEDFRFSDSD